MGTNAKKSLHEGVIVPTASKGSEPWCITSVEKWRVNNLDMKCMRRLAGVSRIYRVVNEGVSKRAESKRELATRVDQRVLRWFGHVERMGEYLMTTRVLMAEVSEGG